ncbi:hypothetical protein FCM35_KLT04447 [Carex littledalei]|uniref:Uncharacterized protein n=1 Tax=Carex littledalei TaxID=544730 RepID=A0A833VQD0_9POAL|nr:hypothetical protein FCM35_KLT04447 [Carex littledalei]
MGSGMRKATDLTHAAQIGRGDGVAVPSMTRMPCHAGVGGTCPMMTATHHIKA